MFYKPVILFGPLVLVLACGVSELPRPQPESNPGPSDPIDTGGTPGTGNTGGTKGTGGTGGNVATGGGGGSGTGGKGGSSGGSGGGGTAIGGTGGSKDAGPSPQDQASQPPNPPSGQTVTINGTAVPKEKAIVFLHIGHSNMAGRTTTPQALRPLSFETHPRLWSYGKGGVWKAAKEPLSADNMTGSCGGVGCVGLPFGAGPGMSILRTAMAAAPEDVYVISIGRGQSGTTAGYCRSFRKGGLLYDFVMVPAMELKGKVTFAGVWTMLGLSEGNDTSANNARFADCMVGVANDMRTDLGEPDMPFLMGDWEEADVSDLTRDSALGKLIIGQLQMVPGRLPRSVIIPSDGLPINPLDGHHYDLTGHKMWAERGMALLKMKGWMPWGNP